MNPDDASHFLVRLAQIRASQGRASEAGDWTDQQRTWMEDFGQLAGSARGLVELIATGTLTPEAWQAAVELHRRVLERMETRPPTMVVDPEPGGGELGESGNEEGEG